MFQDNAQAACCIGQDIQDSRVKERQPILSRGFSTVQHKNRTAFRVVAGGNPISLQEGVVQGVEVVETLKKVACWKLAGLREGALADGGYFGVIPGSMVK